MSDNQAVKSGHKVVGADGGVIMEWDTAVRDLTEPQRVEFCKQRGFSNEFAIYLQWHRLLGSYRGDLAFPVFDRENNFLGVQYHPGKGKWFYAPEGVRVQPLVIGNPSVAETVWVFEGTPDALTAMDVFGWHKGAEAFSKILIVVTRGAGKGRGVYLLCKTATRIIAFTQNDPPTDNGNPTPAERWLRNIAFLGACPVFKVTPPAGIKDFNDWLLQGGTKQEFTNALEAASPVLKTVPPSVGNSPNQPEIPAASSASKDEELPWITLPSGPMTITECAERLFPRIALAEVLFNRGGKIMELGTDDRGGTILLTVTAHGFRSRMELFAKFEVHRVGANGGPVRKPTSPTVDIANALLESLPIKLLPKIKGVVNCPVLLANDAGECRIVGQGYDRDSQLLVAGGKEPLEVQLDEAVDTIKSLLRDFRFQTRGDYSRALASIITPALKLGGHITGSIPADVAEADVSQAGKTFRQNLIAACYNEVLTLVTQKKGGVGSDDESFNVALVRGRPFIQLDNRRGKMESSHIEAFLTATSMFGARIPHVGNVDVDPSAFYLFLTSNGVEATRDFANRSSIIRINKQPQDYVFAKYQDLDVLDYIRANQPYVLGCIFSVVLEWLRLGKPKKSESQHDFREWCQSLDFIVQEIFHEAPLMQGHLVAQERVSNPALTFIRKVAIAAEQTGNLDKRLTAREIYQLASQEGIDIPGFRDNGEENACKVIGMKMAQLFNPAAKGLIELEGYTIARHMQDAMRLEGCGSFAQKYYLIRKSETADKTTATTVTPG